MTTGALVFAILQAVATFAGLGLVGAGLFTWRRQLHGTVEYDLARRLLRRVYDVRDKIGQVRVPAIFGGEFAAAFAEAGIKPDDTGAGNDPRSTGLVYQRRWNALVTASTDLDVELLEAEVIWGAAVREAHSELRMLVAELSIAIEEYLEQRARPPGSVGTTRDELQRVKRVLYDINWPADNPNEYTAKVLAVVERFETIVRPHLRRSAIKSPAKHRA